jgi:hypothetical protein
MPSERGIVIVWLVKQTMKFRALDLHLVAVEKVLDDSSQFDAKDMHVPMERLEVVTPERRVLDEMANVRNV